MLSTNEDAEFFQVECQFHNRINSFFCETLGAVVESREAEIALSLCSCSQKMMGVVDEFPPVYKKKGREHK
jgi:hypothetical protein